MFTIDNIRKEKKIVIYGAGGVAIDVIKLLTSINPQLIIEIVVTEIENNVSDLLGYKVRSYVSAKEILKNNLVIVAMVNPQKIVSFLYEKGIRNVISVFELKEILYMDLFKYPIQKDVIMFTNFNGKGYGGNPKYICEKIRNQYKCVWAVENIDEIMPKEILKVKYGTYEYYKWLSKAKIWVDNDHKNILTKKREKQYYIQTWHGAGPLKKIEHDADTLASSYLKMADMDISMTDLYISPLSFTTEQYRRAFKYTGEILECGYPRNDILFKKKDDIELFQNKKNDFWIIYAPTFRETKSNTVDVKELLKIFEKKYGRSCKILIREHPKMKGNIDYKFNNKVMDMTDYPDVQELLAISDVLITDYSSIMWDFSLQKKPVFLYHPDKKKFLIERGFYLDFSELPYIEVYDMDDFEKKVDNFDENKYLIKLNNFFKYYKSFDDGNAAQKVANIIREKVGE